MDLKGQYFCERTFLTIMWVVTMAAAILTFVIDNVFVMFVTFASGLAVSAIVSFVSRYFLLFLNAFDMHSCHVPPTSPVTSSASSNLKNKTKQNAAYLSLRELGMSPGMANV